jgi:hypothetical protein
LEEEMKQTYATERGSKGIIIKMIIESKTRLETKLMSCKLLIKCHKEEVPASGITTSTHCVKRITLRWIPYLLNLFLEDCKYA